MSYPMERSGPDRLLNAPEKRDIRLAGPTVRDGAGFELLPEEPDDTRSAYIGRLAWIERRVRAPLPFAG